MGHIQGIVRDDTNNNPISSVNVSSVWGNTQTAGDGTYYISVTVGYSAKVTFSKSGYETFETWITAGPNDYYTINALLSPLPSGEVEVLGHWMCGSYDANGNPTDIKNQFTASEDIYQITKFGLNWGGVVEWWWYRNGSLYYNGSPQTIPGGNWDWWQLGLGFYSLPSGNWYVDVYFNGEWTLRDYFTVGFKDIKETIGWESLVPTGSHTFYLFSYYGRNTDNTPDGFQIYTYNYLPITTESMSRQDKITTQDVSKFDCMTLVTEVDGGEIVKIYDWRIDNNVV